MTSYFFLSSFVKAKLDTEERKQLTISVYTSADSLSHNPVRIGKAGSSSRSCSCSSFLSYRGLATHLISISEQINHVIRTNDKHIQSSLSFQLSLPEHIYGRSLINCKTMHRDNPHGAVIGSSTEQLQHSISLSSKVIFALICACNLIQNAIVGGSNNAIMTTLESGFYMTSTETGLFQSVYELVAIFTYPLVGYFGDRSGRKVRWIAVSMGILASGFLVMSVPHLLESKRGKPPLDPHIVDHLTLCNPNRTISVCSLSNNLRFLSHLKYVFYLSNVINACGSAALPTLAITLIEDLFPQEKAALAQGLLPLSLVS